MEIQISIEQAKSLFTWPDSKPNITPETNGWFTHASANVLSMFIQHLNPRFIAELGSWTGTGSTRFLLDTAPNSHLLCFDHWSPNVNDHGNSGTTVYADDDPELLQLPKIWDSFLYNTWEHKNHLTPITLFIQQVRSAELSGTKTISMDTAKARLLVLALSEIQDKLLQDYETMYNALRRSIDTEIVTITMDGGGLEDSK